MSGLCKQIVILVFKYSVMTINRLFSNILFNYLHVTIKLLSCYDVYSNALECLNSLMYDQAFQSHFLHVVHTDETMVLLYLF